MANNDFIAEASIDVDADVERVWRALVDPEEIRRYMFGTKVVSDWKQGSPIVWKGEWEGRAYEDHGMILELTPPRRLSYSHFSPLTGQPDVPENYHTVTIQLSRSGTGTHVRLTQDNNPTEDAQNHSRKNWTMMLEGLKKHLAES
jgi:uncharacterized protein YndB with AHSA1/START domain